MRVDDATAARPSNQPSCRTSAFLVESQIRPIIVAPEPCGAGVVRRDQPQRQRRRAPRRRRRGALAAGARRDRHGANRSPRHPSRRGYVPVIEPTTFSPFSRDETVALADDVASPSRPQLPPCARSSLRRRRRRPSETNAIINELTPAEALVLARRHGSPSNCAPRFAPPRAASVKASRRPDPRRARRPRAIIEMLTAHHLNASLRKHRLSQADGARLAAD